MCVHVIGLHWTKISHAYHIVIQTRMGRYKLPRLFGIIFKFEVFEHIFQTYNHVQTICHQNKHKLTYKLYV